MTSKSRLKKFKMASVADKIYAWEGLVFNLLCALYFAFLSPAILEITYHNVHHQASFHPWLGFALVTITVLEIYAFPQKMKYVHKAVLNHNQQSINGFIMWMFHTVISILIIFFTIEAFGIEITEKGAMNNAPWYVVVLPIIVVIKELYFLFFIFGDNDRIEGFDRPNKKEWIIDLILMSYACLAYTVTWETITKDMDMGKQDTVLYIANICVAGVLFLSFYMPLRIPYYVEEIAQMKTKKDVAKFVFSILIVLISVIANL